MTLAVGRGAHTWLTSVLRPAGTLDASAAGRLTEVLTTIAASSDMVVVDLTATRVPAPRRLATALRAPAQQLAGPGRCLLLVGAGADLVAELDRAAVPAVCTETSGSFAV
ncbi:MAG TPA: hypothetical protein VFA45_20990 [Actinomycetes bacterium]|nr:hypothetical protein [Actinomycetes bacterium]